MKSSNQLLPHYRYTSSGPSSAKLLIKFYFDFPDVNPFIGVICKLVSLENDVSFFLLRLMSKVQLFTQRCKKTLMLPSALVDLCSHNYNDDVSVFILLLLLLE